jgi:hypothetical protein
LEEVPSVGEDRGHPGADVIALDEGGVADADPGDIGDGVQGTGREDPGGDPEVAEARSPLVRYVLAEQGDGETENEGKQDEKPP